MAIGDKLKVTRDQLAEFIESHNTIRQFERLFEYINTFVIPNPEVNNSNCFIERYDTGWVANSDWTDAEFLITHGLSSSFTDLIFDFYLSKDGTEEGAFKPMSEARLVAPATGTATNDGLTAFAVDDDSLKFYTGLDGIVFVDIAGSIVRIDTEAWYYKVVVTKLTILT